MDKETKKILSEGEQIQQMTETQGWQIVKERIFKRLADAGSILGIESKDPEKMMLELSAKQMAVQIVIDWLREDVDGEVEKHKNYNEILTKQQIGYLRYKK